MCFTLFISLPCGFRHADDNHDDNRPEIREGCNRPRKKASKSQKPYSGYPLAAHPNGQWCKTIRGKVHFFGVWHDSDAALTKYLDSRDDLQAGRVPRLSQMGNATTADMVNAWLATCDHQRAAGELQPITFDGYVRLGKMIVDQFGRNTDPKQLRPADFASFRLAVAKKYSQSRISKVVAVCRMLFKWAYDSELLSVMPRFAPDLFVATNKAMRIEKVKNGKKLSSAKEV